MRTKRRYVRRDEFKFTLRLPAPFQRVLFRMRGCKTYVPGTWDATAKAVRYGECRTDLCYLAGWVPENQV